MARLNLPKWSNFAWGARTHEGAPARTINGLIVITDNQTHDRVPAPKGRGYVINVASYKNGVGYGKWVHIDGWSEAVVE